MSQNCHNSGKICWNLLGELISYTTKKLPDGILKHTDELKYFYWIDSKKATHFGKVMANVIKEFSETYKNEIVDELNPTTWEHGDIINSQYPKLAYADSLTTIYIRLNLILLNTKLNKTPIITDLNFYYVCSGEGGKGLCHDEYLEDKFIEIKKKMLVRYGENSHKYDELKKMIHESRHDFIDAKNYMYRIELTKELVEEIREYLKVVFICLISFYRSEPHRHLVKAHEISYIVKCLHS